MKKEILIFLLLLNNFFLFGQSNPHKPGYVIIANDTIITLAKVDSLAKLGYVRSIAKGVTEEERNKLFEQFGSRIGDKEFIIIVTLYSEAEKAQRQSAQPQQSVKPDTTANKNGYLVSINDTAKDFTVQMINGETIRLSDLKGKVVMLNFWATWCAPCLMEFYDFPSKIIAPFKNSNFLLLPVSRGERMELVKAKMKHLQKDGIGFNVGIDPTEEIWKRFAEGAIPKSFLIDKNGIVRYMSTGSNNANLDETVLMIKKLLKE
ncbi:MAG: TlpA family protein disulfide reductase [Sphingobacteriales bacterium]|nr:TlpA family protein disulfide reductase [Sphingobacteriales bacterium]